MSRLTNVLKMDFSKIYAMLLAKALKKGRTQQEFLTVVYWLTGHDENSLKETLNRKVCVGEFYSTFPCLNENSHLITGSVCGCKVEELTDLIEKNMRLLDKLVDELAKGRAMNKILRGSSKTDEI